MRCVILSIVTVLIIFSLSSCTASYQNRYFPVKNMQQRESSFGFSITPPTGKHWYEKLNNNSLYYLKKTDRKDYSIYTKATEIHLKAKELKADTFLQFVIRSKKLNMASGNFKNVSFQIIQNNKLSPLCVRYIQKYEDHSRKYNRKNTYIDVKNNGLVCMHPDKPRNGVDMYYVESTLHTPEKSAQLFTNEGEYFLSSLKFHPRGY